MVSPIYFPLESAAEVSFVESALADFRLRRQSELQEAPTDLPLTKEQWKHMTVSEKLDYIDKEWSLDALRDIKPWILSNATVLAVMDLCAEAPNTWVFFKAACKVARMDSSQGKGQMQALTKKTVNQMGKQTWPMVANATPPGGGGLAYMMSPAISDLWKAVRNES